MVLVKTRIVYVNKIFRVTVVSNVKLGMLFMARHASENSVIMRDKCAHKWELVINEVAYAQQIDLGLIVSTISFSVIKHSVCQTVFA